MSGKKGVIISGGTIERDFALAFLQDYAGLTQTAGDAWRRGLCARPKEGSLGRDGKLTQKVPQRDYEVIAADRGLVFCLENGIPVDAVVGDFDSAGRSVLKELEHMPAVDIRTFQPEKDWTDTELAVDLAIERGWTEAVLLGGTGTRLDHVLGNLQGMELALDRGLSLIIADPYNRIRMTDRGFEIRKAEQSGHYVSLVPWGGPVKDLKLSGFHYDVDGIELITGASRGISNEIEAPAAKAEFSAGKLLVIESRDEWQDREGYGKEEL